MVPHSWFAVAVRTVWTGKQELALGGLVPQGGRYQGISSIHGMCGVGGSNGAKKQGGFTGCSVVYMYQRDALQ